MIPLGNLLWNVEPVVPYVVGNGIPATIYIRNDDVTSHTYGLTVVTAKGTQVIDTYVIDVGTPIIIDAGDTAEYFGMLNATVNDCTLTVELINQDVPGFTSIIDSIQTTLVPPEASSTDLTLIGGAVSSNLLNTIIEIMLVVMMMKMMTNAVGPSQQKAKEPVYPRVAQEGV